MSELQNQLLNLGFCFLQAILLLLIAPCISGIIKKLKALLQNRVGSSIWQEYYDIYKWWRKPTIITPYTSGIFRLAPCIYFVTTLIAAVMLPSFFLCLCRHWRCFRIRLYFGFRPFLYGRIFYGCSYCFWWYGW